MKNVFVLGAGASKAYDKSPTGQRMPVAKDFFPIYAKLPINLHPWALKTKLLLYLHKRDGTQHLDLFNFNEDIEDLHTEVQESLYKIIEQDGYARSRLEEAALNAYCEVIFLFIAGINQIQNGPVSKTHIELAKLMREDDAVITYNWDTLMDRALNEVTGWSCDSGYMVKPQGIYRNGWRTPGATDSHDYPRLLKLYGSSNWLTSYQTFEKGKMVPMQATPIDHFFVYEHTRDPYSAFAGRYMAGYEPFSYGYYPPNLITAGREAPKGYVISKVRPKHPFMPESNLDDSGLVSMPLIIPPVRHKEYNYYGNLFQTLWDEARQRLEAADRIFVIGYSFPKTDIRSNELFLKAFTARTTMPEVIIINPEPDSIADRFRYDFGITDDKLTVIKDYFGPDIVEREIKSRI